MLRRKRINEFLNSVHKENISNEIRERNQEKLQVSLGKQDTSSGELEELISPQLPYDIKTVDIVHDQEKTSSKKSVQNISEKFIRNSSLMTEVVQGLLQGFLVNFIEDNIEFINSVPSDSSPAAVELALLVHQATNTKYDDFVQILRIGQSLTYKIIYAYFKINDASPEVIPWIIREVVFTFSSRKRSSNSIIDLTNLEPLYKHEDQRR
ncbi:hypothetical protein Glove_122g91 [Diversispora epigaea]|uniref:Uncharacterized protein n=1 Tax=Diversispora epigaea TaxID=1348612 RepID=A0A397IZ42_9GLOM|nr:hypothetical protein Glove_122g91 [Diversispora epigaea]